MKTRHGLFAAFSLAFVIIFSFACNKDNSSGSNNIPAGKSQLSVYLMDGPVSFAKVLVDIRQIAVKIDTAQKQEDEDHEHQWDDDHDGAFWDTLTIKPGVYDLLQLRNGVDTLLASGVFPAGKVVKVRITLGSDNSIYTDSVTSFPLVVFGPHPYFDINVRHDDVFSLSSNDFKLWLDFDLQRSIVFFSGTFYLKPHVVVFNDHNKARIEGEVLPDGASPLVSAYNGTDTVYAVPGEHGRFVIRNVNAGTYSVHYYGHQGYQDTTISNITVGTGNKTKLPDITLHK